MEQKNVKINEEESRFSYMNLDEEVNSNDVKTSLASGELFGIVDEEKGGIIAYAIGKEHAEYLVNSLKKLHGGY